VGASPGVVDAVLDVDVPAGAHRLSIRTMGHGESRLYGVVVENGDRGVVYDSLGMVGARAQRMLGFDPTHLRSQLATRDVSLVVIAFGGNDADDERTQGDFESIFRRVAHLVREARPEASCLLMAPLDQAERDERGAITTLPTIPLIVEAMRLAARREGCAFFDTWTAMGGDGAMGRWSRQEPRLSGGDFRHATPAGYRVIGEMLYRALLMGFRRYERSARE
jgi:lysophospholipase L1-like esterase